MDPEVQSVWVKDGLSFQVPIYPNDDLVRVQIEDFKLKNHFKLKFPTATTESKWSKQPCGMGTSESSLLFLAFHPFLNTHRLNPFRWVSTLSDVMPKFPTCVR